MKFPRELNALLQVSAVPDRHQQSRDGGPLRLGFLVHVSAHWPGRHSAVIYKIMPPSYYIYSAVKVPLYIKLCLNYFHFCSKQGGTQKFGPPRAARRKKMCLSCSEIMLSGANTCHILSVSDLL